MSNARDNVIAAGLVATRSFAGTSIVYRRGVTSLTFKALKGRRQLLVDMGISQTQADLTDWIFPASELATLTATAPAIGDKVAIGGRVYSLSAAEDGKHWRWVDPAETWLRVHTVLTT